MIETKEGYNTIFGKDYFVWVYPLEGQHRNHISICVNIDQLKEIRELIKVLDKK